MTPTLTADRGAILSADNRHRYRLWRVVGPHTRRVLFVMLNPSTADADRDDPTIRRCIGFAQAWECGRLDVVNLYAYRATDPRVLPDVPFIERVGPDNNQHIRDAIDDAQLLVVAWGADPIARDRQGFILGASHPRPLWCLGHTTRSGGPRHPLYVRKEATLVRWENP